MAQTNERAFEAYVETTLKEKSGWKAGVLAEWDEAHALFPARIFAFIEETQPKRWAEMQKLHGVGLPELLLKALVSQIIPYADADLEMLYSYGRFLLPHLPLDRDTSVVQVGDDVALQYYRMERIYSGGIDLKEGEVKGVYSPTDVGTGKAKDEKVPLSEIISVLNERFGTEFSEEDRLFFRQIKERATKNEQIIQTALANPLDKFQLGIRKLIEDLLIQRMADNDRIVTRYMDDSEFQSVAFPILAREIFEAVRGANAAKSGGRTT